MEYSFYFLVNVIY